MIAKRIALALLPVALLGAAAFAPPAARTLPYDLAGLLGASAEAFVQPVEPGEQYPPTLEDRTIATVPDAVEAKPSGTGRRPKLALTLDASITGDSNVTNATDRREVAVDYGTGPLPVPLDPNLREKSGLGVGLSASGTVKLPIADGVDLAFGAEGYVLEYDGARGDDSSLLGAGGVEVQAGGGRGSLQVIAFERWYGGVSAMEGFGLRGSWRQDVGQGRHLALFLDARRYDSGYGRAFGGNQASAYLTFDSPLARSLTGAGGVYVRRDDLREDSFSSTETGAYASLTRYLGPHFTGGVSGGVSRAVFDAPILYLSPDARRDWRSYASLWLTTRKPLALGLYPSLTYTYNRTSSSIGFYDSDRHRLRLGFSRSF